MRALELLAPARNLDIGIAAIDCGADAVYIAGPSFGARHAAGNTLEDISALCSYAHRFGVRIFLTVNTIIYDSELSEARSLMLSAQQAGVDAFIVQDSALFDVPGITVPIHASTQCAIRDVRTARLYESLGAGRVVLERQLSLEQIREIASAVKCETEVFVHGALCVCYSGQCYLSQAIGGRSANRGDCMQACRSRYDLVEEVPAKASGRTREGGMPSSARTLVRDKALLSLRDLKLLGRLAELAEAGADSFKIEGRLKNISYVRNVVRQYSMALDRIVEASGGRYRRASWGRVTSGFEPAPDKTFNRGYTELYIDGRRGSWAAMDAPKGMGEYIGTVEKVQRGAGTMELTLRTDISLTNGDGFCFISREGILGFRGDVCSGSKVKAADIPALKAGDRIWRNIDAAFERRMLAAPCRREIPVRMELRVGGRQGAYELDIYARSQDDREVRYSKALVCDAARDGAVMAETLRRQLLKRHLHYLVEEAAVSVRCSDGSTPFMTAAQINALRREAVEALDAAPAVTIPMRRGRRDREGAGVPASLDYKANIANSRADALMRSLGAREVSPAYEVEPVPGAELMRTRYCIKYELGLCTRLQGHAPTGPLSLVNNGRRFPLGFDCSACEMTVRAEHTR